MSSLLGAPIHLAVQKNIKKESNRSQRSFVEKTFIMLKALVNVDGIQSMHRYGV
jgi:hypothetical protein